MKLNAKGEVQSPFVKTEDRETQRRKKREAVLLAAVQMFNEKGFHATSLDEVAASLGVTKPVIYYYLGNKENVLLECVRRGLDELQAATDLAHLEPGTGSQRLRAYLLRYAEFSLSDFGRCTTRTESKLLSSESADELLTLKRRVDHTLRELIQEGIDDGSIAAADTRLAAFTLFGALNWTAHWYSERGPDRPEVIADKMVTLLLDGLIPRDQAATGA